MPAGILALAGVATEDPVFVDDEPGLIRALYEGRCDFGARWDYPYPFAPSEWQLSGMPDVDQLVVPLARTKPIIPNLNITLSTSLSAPRRSTVIDGLLELSRSSEGVEALGLVFGGPSALVIANDSAYDELRTYLTAMGGGGRELVSPTYYGVASTPVWNAPPAGTLVLDSDPIEEHHFILSSRSNAMALEAMTASLARMNGDGTIEPVLAKEVPSIGGGARLVGLGEDERLEVEFVLRPNARWQDGEPIAGEDLVFSWEFIMDPEFPSDHLTDSGWAAEVYVRSVEAVGSDRVVYSFMSARELREAVTSGGALGDPAPYKALVGHEGAVVPLDYWNVGRYLLPRHLLSDTAPADFAESAFAHSPVYAGPYRLVELGRDEDSIVLEANPYFVLGTPRIDRVVLGPRYFTEGALNGWQIPSFLQEALVTGAVQGQLGLPAVNTRLGEDAAVYDQIASLANADVKWVPRDSWEVLDFNLDNPHLRDRRVREAIAMAIDRQGLIDRLFDRRAGLMSSYLPDWHPLYAGDPVLPSYEYNVEEARALLEAAGYDLSTMPAIHPDKGPLVLDLATWDVIFYPRGPIAEFIREALNHIGIEVNIRMYGNEFEGQDCSAVRNGRRFDLGMAAWVGIARIPIVWAERVTLTDSIPSTDNGCPLEKANWSGWTNAEADRLYYEALRDGRVALEDPGLYGEAWAQHQRLWASDLPSLPLFNSYRPVTVSTQLKGVEPSPFALGGGVEDTWNIYDWELSPP